MNTANESFESKTKFKYLGTIKIKTIFMKKLKGRSDLGTACYNSA
jgi:hypothetical protein